jgi:serine/threonine-protein kinase RsbW
MGTQSITVPARLEDINRICEAVAIGAEQAGFDDRTAYACQLAVCEAVENIVVHGYGPDAQGVIQADINGQSGELVIELRDRAPQFNPVEQEPKPPTPPDDPPVGSLGLYILQRVMDEISYERVRGENRLRLYKRAGSVNH